MDRRKTIFIAVLVNAGLLVLLFMVALHQEETPVNRIGEETLSQERGPLFTDLQEEIFQEPIAALPVEPAPKPQEPLHQLPLIAKEAAPPVLSLPPPPAPNKSAFSEVAVKKGDTLEKIARLHQTTVDEIVSVNQLSSSFLRIGQILKIPTEKTLAKEKPAVKRALPVEAIAQEYYIVKVGDNPWTIARKNNLKVNELLKLNELNEEKARRLKPGDRLRIR